MGSFYFLAERKIYALPSNGEEKEINSEALGVLKIIDEEGTHHKCLATKKNLPRFTRLHAKLSFFPYTRTRISSLPGADLFFQSRLPRTLLLFRVRSPALWARNFIAIGSAPISQANLCYLSGFVAFLFSSNYVEREREDTHYFYWFSSQWYVFSLGESHALRG